MLVFLFCLWWLKSDAETGLARAGCFVFQGLEDNPSYSCLSHASHSHSHRLPTTPEFQEKSRELPSRENWAVLRTWHAFILQSPHRMTFFDPAEGGKKICARFRSGLLTSQNRTIPHAVLLSPHSSLNTAAKSSSKQGDIQWLNSQSLGLGSSMLALRRATQISKRAGKLCMQAEGVAAGICLEIAAGIIKMLLSSCSLPLPNASTN